MARSIKDLYPQKYEEYKNSDYYRYINKNQTEMNKAKHRCKVDANFICAICKDENALDAHHIIPLKDGGSNDQSNLICLCRRCHQRVHKDVYVIEPITKKVSIGNIKSIYTTENKPEYVKEYEKRFNVVFYKNTGKYFTFIDGVHKQFTVKEIKEAVGFKTKRELGQMSEAKKQSIKDRKILGQYKDMFRKNGNKNMWHQLCDIINKWDTLEVSQKKHVFEILNTNFPIAQQFEI